MSSLRRLLAAAGKQLKKHPVIGNSSLYVVLYSCGDLTQQTILGKPKFDFTSTLHVATLGACLFAPFNYNCTLHVATLGACLFAPFNYNWYKLLDRHLVGKGIKFTLKKVIIDQAIAGSIGILFFYVGLAVLERREDKFAELRQKGLKTYMTACVFWPTVQTINFTFLPNHLRTAYVGCAAFLWTNILCSFKHQPLHDLPDEPVTPSIKPELLSVKSAAD